MTPCKRVQRTGPADQNAPRPSLAFVADPQRQRLNEAIDKSPRCSTRRERRNLPNRRQRRRRGCKHAEARSRADAGLGSRRRTLSDCGLPGQPALTGDARDDAASLRRRGPPPWSAAVGASRGASYKQPRFRRSSVTQQCASLNDGGPRRL